MGMGMTEIVMLVLEKRSVGQPLRSFEQDLKIPRIMAGHASSSLKAFETIKYSCQVQAHGTEEGATLSVMAMLGKHVGLIPVPELTYWFCSEGPGSFWGIPGEVTSCGC